METIKDLNFLDTLLPLAVIVFIIATGVVLLNQHFHKKLYQQKLEQETLKTVHQNELLRSSISIQEEERKRIAQDLHDELGAMLSIMRMHLVMLELQNPAPPENILPGLQNARQLSETALASIRSISHQLMPPQLEKFGLIKTLESVTDQINDAGRINIQLALLSDIPELSWDINLGLYRISMELITNTIKHAAAKNINIDFGWLTGYITCMYTDNGKGLTQSHPGNGSGLKSIEARASALKGTVEFGNTTDRNGFYAFIKIPVENSTLT
jgi:signal transduction histidine kinase